jgi:hypothetical protein
MKMKAIIVAVVLAAFLAPLAVAGGKKGSTTYGYGSNGGIEGTIQKGAKPTKTPTKTGSSLPFTGVDLGIVAAGAAALILAGGTLRRVSRSSD